MKNGITFNDALSHTEIIHVALDEGNDTLNLKCTIDTMADVEKERQAAKLLAPSETTNHGQFDETTIAPPPPPGRPPARSVPLWDHNLPQR